MLEPEFCVRPQNGLQMYLFFFFFCYAAPVLPVQKQSREGSSASPALCMRAEMGPAAARRSALAESLGFLDVRVQDCQAELLASTVTNIGPFLEDEFSVDGQPMQLHMSNVTITMKVSVFLSSWHVKCLLWMSVSVESQKLH